MNNNQPKMKLCEHCVELVNVLRGCGATIGVSAQHYAMAAIVSARAEGLSIAELHAAIDLLARVDAFDRPSPIDLDLVGGVLVHPPIDGTVIHMGRGEDGA